MQTSLWGIAEGKKREHRHYAEGLFHKRFARASDPAQIDLTTSARAPCARRLLLRGGADIARSVPTMHCIENPKLRRPRGVEDLQHMRNAAIRFFLWPTPAAK